MDSVGVLVLPVGLETHTEEARHTGGVDTCRGAEAEDGDARRVRGSHLDLDHTAAGVA